MALFNTLLIADVVLRRVRQTISLRDESDDDCLPADFQRRGECVSWIAYHLTDINVDYNITTDNRNHETNVAYSIFGVNNSK